MQEPAGMFDMFGSPLLVNFFKNSNYSSSNNTKSTVMKTGFSVSGNCLGISSL